MAEYRAKRSAKLELLKEELKKGFIEEEFEVGGHKWRLRTLTEDDECWADTYLRTMSTAAILSSRKAPRLAVSIVSLDGELTKDMFGIPDDMPAEAKKDLQDNPVRFKYWLYDQMLYFLLEEGNRSFVNGLWEKYEALTTKREESAPAVPN